MSKPRRKRRTHQDRPATLTPFAVMDAPELAALALLEHAVEVAWIALLARHVDLLDPDAPFRRAPQPGAAVTTPFFNAAHVLTDVIRRYRDALALAAAIRNPPVPGDGFISGDPFA